MAHANTEIPAFNQAVWTTHSDNFKQNITGYLSAETMTLLESELDQLKSAWEGGAPDFAQFQTNCRTIFREKIPTYRIPSMEEFLKKFLTALFFTTLALIIGGLLCMAGVECAALLGLVTIAAFHFKALAIASTVIGSVAATLHSVGLFNPFYANFWTKNFVDTVQNNTAATPRPNV